MCVANMHVDVLIIFLMLTMLIDFELYKPNTYFTHSLYIEFEICQYIELPCCFLTNEFPCC